MNEAAKKLTTKGRSVKLQRQQQTFAEPTPNVAFANSCLSTAIAARSFAKQGLLLLLVLALGACDMGGGGSGGSSSAAAGPAVSSVLTIDLPPGETRAMVGWDPSEGDVTVYQVYESRNGGDYQYIATVSTERASISGTDGDRVRVSVLAVNSSGRPSNSSPPSPELRFHAAEPGMVSAANSVNDDASQYGAPSVIEPTDPATSTTGASTSDPVVVADNSANASNSENSDTLSDDPAVEEDSTTLDATLREMLVRSDARFGTSDLSDAAQIWLQDRVEEQFNAGVQLVGTGELDQDGLRELVWQDPSGQLFISTGRSVLDVVETSELPATFEEGLRLQTTERFVALTDLTGDGVGEWVVEDASMGEVWIIDAVSLEIVNARGEQGTQIAGHLVGHGDFDADGRNELVWQQPDGRLTIDSPYDTRDAATTGAIASLAETSRLLTIADINGDGRDDLATIDDNGRLEWMVTSLETQETAQNGGPTLRFDTRLGPDLSTQGLELLVTLDVDGQTEIVWFDGTTIEIWNAETGPL